MNKRRRTCTKWWEPEKDRHPRDLRIDAIELLVESGLNAPYLDKNKPNKTLRFNIGSPVVAATQGVFYSATVKLYDGLSVPDSMYPKGTNVNFQQRVPSVIVSFEDWPEDYDDPKYVPESELFTSMFPCRPVDTLALLMAHEHNLIRCEKLKVKETGLGPGAFLMTDELYQALEKSWQKDTGETSSFGQHCGRLPGPYYSTKPLSTERKGKGHHRRS